MKVGVVFFFKNSDSWQTRGDKTSSTGSDMKEDENLKVGEDSEKDQFGERLYRGKRMK